MCMLLAEVLMLVGGLYALVAGKVRLTKNMYLEGQRARIAGLFLAAPLPLAFLTGTVLGTMMSMGVLPYSAEGVAGLLEFFLVLGGLAGAVIYATVTRPKVEELPTEEGLQPEEL